MTSPDEIRELERLLARDSEQIGVSSWQAAITTTNDIIESFGTLIWPCPREFWQDVALTSTTHKVYGDGVFAGLNILATPLCPPDCILVGSGRQMRIQPLSKE